MNLNAHLDALLKEKSNIKIEMSESQKTLYRKGIDLLSRREYSKKELKIKLLKKFPNSLEVDFVIDLLDELNYLSESRYCRAVILNLLKKGH